MADLIIKPEATSGNKLILKDQAGGAVLTTADSGATLADTIALGTPASGVVTNLTGALQGHPSIVLGSAQFVAATGPDGAAGTIDGDYKYHVFTATKTGSAGFVVSAAGNPAGSNTLEYYILAGGGGGDDDWGAGAGAGGCLTNNDMVCPVVGNHNVTVGAGGSRGASAGVAGGNSVFNGLTALGGAPGINATNTTVAARSGGCGSSGQGAVEIGNFDRGGEGKKRPQYQGGNGGFCTRPVSNVSAPGGGGGIGGDGQNGSLTSSGTMRSGDGGPGLADIGAGTVRGGGGAGGGYSPRSLTAGTGGPGGGNGEHNTGGAGTSGTANYGGGGGGGAGGGGQSGSGGSGIVIIKYKFQ